MIDRYANSGACMHGPRLAEQRFGIAVLCAFLSISFMLLLKGAEWTTEAIAWSIVSTGRVIFGHLVTHRFLEKP